MKLITRDTDYAIRAIRYIAQSGKPIVSVSEIEKALNLPRPFLRKILQTLQKSGVLTSIKGNKGGFSLDKNYKKISLVDVIKVYQGDVSFTDCLLKQEVCPDIAKCVVRKKIKAIEKMVNIELNKITIDSILKCK
ncbi:MAG: Rrf2 family transcriptional regulator [Candidatus Omnitrophica bacterium]|nr:Rrf2 family transcriptional regulator [Candidatus Omnitrophota bacterium]MBU1996151.1 Rrf2 family transcriptional regulator [Candidatus Omnitrophota bacterium]MBU4333449.1 Rrf2 family transcriptional regulator [Candidatus Omnitrophota bacterium]